VTLWQPQFSAQDEMLHLVKAGTFCPHAFQLNLY